MRSITVKLEPEQVAWLESQARGAKRSKGAIIRELISERLGRSGESLGHQLADLEGCLEGSRDLSTRAMKGYGRG